MKILAASALSGSKLYCKPYWQRAVRGVDFVDGRLWILDDLENERVSITVHGPEEYLISLDKFVPDGPDPHGYKKIARTRNVAREFFLNSKYDALLFLDSDMVCPADTLRYLELVNAHIVSGVYMQRGVIEPIITATNNEGAPGYIKLMPAAELSTLQLSLEVNYVGMGCALLSREVLQSIEFPYKYKGLSGEDFAFCKLANDIGFGRPHIVPLVQCWHFNNSGEGTKLKLSSEGNYAVYNGESAFVRSEIGGVWEAGVPKFGLTDKELHSLGPQFYKGFGDRMTVLHTKYTELFD